MGNFHTAQLELVELVEGSTEDSEGDLEDSRPDALHYQTTLALAYHYCAEYDNAKYMAADVLRRQLKIYLPRHAHQIMSDDREVDEDESSSRVSMTDLSLEEFKILPSIINALPKEAIVQRTCPPLLQTLWVISLILQQESQASLQLSTRILQALWNHLEHGTYPSSQNALRIRYDLALAIRREGEAETSDDDDILRLDKSAKHLRSVYQSRSELLGHKHPETLDAKLEMIITNCTLGRWEGTLDGKNDGLPCEEMDDPISSILDQKNWASVEFESRQISYLYEAQLGGHHPQTLKSLMWLLAVHVLLESKSSNEIVAKILGRLRTVRKERLVDSVNLECKLILIIAQSNRKWANQILEETRKFVEENQFDMWQKQSMLDKMLERVSNEVCVRPEE